MSKDLPVLYLVDASIYLFRAWFSMPDTIVSTEGEPVNAVFGFSRFLCEVLEQAEPHHIVFAWDRSLKSSFRNEIYPPYKANREPAPLELKRQFDWAEELVQTLGIHCAASQRFEADDIVATMVARARREGFRSAVVTADKDLAQVLVEDDFIWDFARGRYLNPAAIRENFGVDARQIPDYLALAGDSVDNIPGLRGIGARTAATLLSHFDDLETIYRRLDDVDSLPIRGAARVRNILASARDDAFRFRELTRLVTDCPLASDGMDEIDIESLCARSAPDWAALEELVERLRLGTGLMDRLKLASAYI